MNTSEIVASLRSECDRIDAAISALEGGSSGTRGGRAAGTKDGGGRLALADGVEHGNGRRKKRHQMSAAGRKRISMAAKARWAKWKKER